jgi:hypothetical protein
LDIHKLLANRFAILTLTLLGVLISSLVVAILVRVFTLLDWHLALLLGSLLRAFYEQMETIRHQYPKTNIFTTAQTTVQAYSMSRWKQSVINIKDQYFHYGSNHSAVCWAVLNLKDHTHLTS